MTIGGSNTDWIDREERNSKIITAAWRWTVQVFNIAVCVFVFLQLRGRDETLMTGLFGILYTTVRTGQLGTAMAARGAASALQDEIEAIKEAVIPAYHREYTEGSENADRIAEANAPLWIEYGGLSIVFFICLFYIFSVLI